MNRTGKFSAVMAVAVTMAAFLTSSAFADSRPRNQTGRERNRGDRSTIQNQRRSMSAQGKIRSMSRHGDGYRVSIDGARYPFYLPSAAYRGRGRGFNDLRVGVSVRLSGWLRGGYVYVDSWDPFYDRGYGGYDRYDRYRDDRYRYDDRYRDGRHDDRYLSGVVERVDYRRGNLLVRDDYRGRRVTVDLDHNRSRGRSIDFRDLRRGDRITLSGTWISGNVFEAYEIESLR